MEKTKTKTRSINNLNGISKSLKEIYSSNSKAIKDFYNDQQPHIKELFEKIKHFLKSFVEKLTKKEERKKIDRDNYLPVKENWDSIWKWPPPEPLPKFKGRLDERNRIKAFIKSSSAGTLFMGGDRGAGKTATVYRALSEITPEPQVIPVKAVFFEEKDKPKEKLTIQLVKQLVRAIYFKDQSEKSLRKGIKSLFCKDDIKDLYRDVNATVFFKRDSEVKTSELKWSFSDSIRELIGEYLALAFALFFATIGINGYISKLFAGNRLFDIIGILIAILIPAVAISRKKSIEKTIEITELTIHELQERISKVVDKLSGQGSEKLVILFDELDHYDGDSPIEEENKVGPNDILNILKSIKLLLQTSNAHFIFLIGPTTYHKSLEPGPFSTIATDKFYLPVAKPSELEDYLDSIFEKPKNSKLKQNFDLHKQLIIKESNGNYYRLIQIVRNKLNYKVGDKPCFPIEDLEGPDVLKASLIKATFPIFEGRLYPPIEGSKNDRLLLDLMKVIDHYDDWEDGVKDKPLPLPAERINKDAVLDYLSHLFTAAVKPVPQPSDNNIQIDWSQLKSIDPEIFRSGISGAIRKEEKEFDKKYNEILERLKSVSLHVGLKEDIEKLERVIDVGNKLFEMTYIPREALEGYVKTAEEAHDEIKNKKLPERRRDILEFITQSALPSLNSIDEILKQKFLSSTPPLVILRTGNAKVSVKKRQLEIDLLKREHQSGVEFASLVEIQKGSDRQDFTDFMLDCEASIRPEGVLNVIFGIKPWDEKNKANNEFYMVRLDSRATGKNGILYKPYGQEAWGNKEMSDKNIVSNKLTKFKISYRNGNLKLKRGQGSKVEAEVGIKEKLLWWGVGNELEETKFVLKLS